MFAAFDDMNFGSPVNFGSTKKIRHVENFESKTEPEEPKNEPKHVVPKNGDEPISLKFERLNAKVDEILFMLEKHDSQKHAHNSEFFDRCIFCMIIFLIGFIAYKSYSSVSMNEPIVAAKQVGGGAQMPPPMPMQQMPQMPQMPPPMPMQQMPQMPQPMMLIPYFAPPAPPQAS